MGPNWKLPHAIEQRKKKRQEERHDDRARNEIRRLDSHRCRVCGRKTNVVHEEKRRGAGGQVTAANSYLACDIDTNGVCHPLLQTYRIWAVMASGAEAFNAREELLFEMTEEIAELVFEGRSRTAQVRIVES